MRRALIEAGHAVGRKRDNYLSARYHRIAARRGKQRAAMAIARSILEFAYHLLRNGTHYVDLGPNYFDQRQAEAVQKRLVKRLELLGLAMTPTPCIAAT